MVKKVQLQYRGWGTALNYEGDVTRGRDHFVKLVDEMAENGCNYLSIGMASPFVADDVAWGCAWPISDPGLRHYVDNSNANARPEREFLGDLIAYAHQHGVKVELHLGAHIMYRAGTRPADWTMVDRRGNPDPVGTCCPDNADFAAAFRVLTLDMVRRYGDPSLGDRAFDFLQMHGPSYRAGTCYCPRSEANFREMFGKPLAAASIVERRAWKFAQLGKFYKEWIAAIRQVNPRLDIAYHSFDSSFETDTGHNIKEEVAAGFTYALPGHHELKKAELFRILDHSCQYLPSILHFSVRRTLPSFYQMSSVVPADIAMVMEWVRQYKAEGLYRDNFIGIQCFNYSGDVPEDNRQAAYEGLRQLVG